MLCFPTDELKDKTIGIIGYGSIGRRVAEIAFAFEMNVLVYTRTPKEDTHVKFVSLDELLSKSDYTKLEISDEARETLGIEGEPYINNGKLFIKCTKYGSAKVKITAIAGGENVATGATMGGTEFTREVSLLSRDSIAENGGWL